MRRLRSVSEIVRTCALGQLPKRGEHPSRREESEQGADDQDASGDQGEDPDGILDLLALLFGEVDDDERTEGLAAALAPARPRESTGSRRVASSSPESTPSSAPPAIDQRGIEAPLLNRPLGALPEAVPRCAAAGNRDQLLTLRGDVAREEDREEPIDVATRPGSPVVGSIPSLARRRNSWTSCAS